MGDYSYHNDGDTDAPPAPSKPAEPSGYSGANTAAQAVQSNIDAGNTGAGSSSGGSNLDSYLKYDGQNKYGGDVFSGGVLTPGDDGMKTGKSLVSSVSGIDGAGPINTDYTINGQSVPQDEYYKHGGK